MNVLSGFDGLRFPSPPKQPKTACNKKLRSFRPDYKFVSIEDGVAKVRV